MRFWPRCKRCCPKWGVPRENIVFVSGIGCSSRFPYYMNTYGIHSIHGRAPTIATGNQDGQPEFERLGHHWRWRRALDWRQSPLAQPPAQCRSEDSSVQQPHLRAYQGPVFADLAAGLTAPSPPPMGSIDYPLNPISVALSAEATFVARTQDTNTKHLSYVLRRAANTRGRPLSRSTKTVSCSTPQLGNTPRIRTCATTISCFWTKGSPSSLGRTGIEAIRMNGTEPEVVAFSDVAPRRPGRASRRARKRQLCLYAQPDGIPVAALPFGVLRALDRPTYTELLFDPNRPRQPNSGARATSRPCSTQAILGSSNRRRVIDLPFVFPRQYLWS